MSRYVQVLTTTDSEDDAVRLAKLITEARLGACVQIVGPIRSLYWWEGKVQDDKEWQLLIKTPDDRLPALKEHIKANHSYDEPEIIATEIIDGSAEYLNWVTEQTRETGVSS